MIKRHENISGLFRTAALVVIIIILLVSACGRNRPSDKPPLHANPNMDTQEKYRPQSSSEFFDDGAAMRVPVAGTVPRGYLRNDNVFYHGLDADSKFVKVAPVEITAPLLARGQERYDIYCAPCHSRVGDGKGIVVNRGYPPPPTFHDPRLRELPNGQIFDVITNGIRNMPSYRHQITPEDRWAIVVYLRALQKSQNARLEDIPAEQRGHIREVK